jgi:hypothetical protein
LGLGLEVKINGKVIYTRPAGTCLGVAARFEEIPFETERMVARWLDLFTEAQQVAAAG